MSPRITHTTQCLECRGEDAHLTGWKAPSGYDLYMRKYHCEKCGADFYVVGGQRSFRLLAIGDLKTESGIASDIN